MAMIPHDRWELATRHQRILGYKECLAEGRGCAGKIVRAHVIPRSQLRQIASEGHIYAVPTRLTAVMRMQRTAFRAEKIGVGEFATLNCFCAKHDKSLFAPLEDRPLKFSSRQLALLHYRALAAEFYQRQNQEKSANTELFFAEQNGLPTDRFQWMSYYGGKAADEAYAAFLLSRNVIGKRRYGDICAIIIRFEAMPSVMSVGAFRPNYNVLGKLTQSLDLPCEYIAMHMISSEKGAALVFTWAQGDDAAEAFAKCFAAQPREQLTSLAIQTAFEHIEHTCMKDEWWLGLKTAQRKSLVERVRRANSLSYRRSYRCLMYRTNYDDWGVKEVKYIRC
jgi:hypothetical protein